MNVVYIAGKFRDATPYKIHCNVIKAEEAALMIWQSGDVALCPHLNTQNFQGELPDGIFLDGCLELLRRCDAIYMLSNYKDSVGSLAELELAKELGLEIYYE